MSQKSNNTESTVSSNTMTEMEQQKGALVEAQGTEDKAKAAAETAADEKKASSKMPVSKDTLAQMKTKCRAWAEKCRGWGRKIRQSAANGKARVQAAWNRVLTEERKAAVRTKGQAIAAKGKAAGNRCKAFVSMVGSKLRAAWNRVLTEKRKAAIKAGWASFADKCRRAGARVEAWCQKLWQQVVRLWNKVMTEKRKAAIKAKWQLVVEKVRPIFDKCRAVIARQAARVSAAWKKLTCEENKQAVKTKANAFWQTIVSLFRRMGNKLVRMVHNIKERETEEGLRTYKLFYISDYEKEATYLRNMSLKGYHFVRNDGFSFDFIKGEPKNYFYLLDYYKVDPSEEELKQWRQEGWEDIFHAPVNYEGSWHFFRRELSEGDMLEYNENNDSRLELFERLTRNWQGILSVVALCTVFSIVAISMQIALHGFPWMIAVCIVLAAICLLVFLIYLNMYYRTRLRIVDIHNARKQKSAQEDPSAQKRVK